MADQQEQMTLVATLVDRVSDRLKEINKNMLATEAAAKKTHDSGAKGADLHRKQIDLLTKSFGQLKDASSSLIMPGFTALGVTSFSLAGAIAAVVGAVKALGDEGLAIEKTTQRSGLLANKIRELQGIGQAWGVSMEQTNEGLSDFGELMDKTARRAPDAMRAWMQIPGLWAGLGSKLDQIKDPNRRIDAVLDFLPRLKYSDQKRNILRIMGLPEDWAFLTRQQLGDLRREEADWLREHQLPADIAKQTDENMRKLRRSFQGLQVDMGVAFSGPVLEAVEAINHFLEQRKNIDAIKDGFDGLGAILKQDVTDLKAINDLLTKVWNWAPAEWMKKSPGQFFDDLQKHHTAAGNGNVAPDAFGNWSPAQKLAAGMSPVAFSQSDTTRYIEEPFYRAMLHALSDWWGQITGSAATAGKGGFTNASFNVADGVPRFGGGGYTNLGVTLGKDVPAGSGPAPGKFTGNKREVAKIVADEWSRAGMSKAGIAGLMQNIMDESGFNPNLRHPDQPAFGGEAHFAHGLYQEGGVEWNHYAAWLAKNYPGADWRDPRMQSRFAAYNLKTNYPAVWARMNAGNRYQAAAAYVSGYLKPAEVYRRGRVARYLHGGVADMEAYTGPLDRPGLAPRVTDGRLLSQQAPGSTGTGKDASASLTVDFRNMPAWAKTAIDHNGKFKEFKVNRGFAMPMASDTD
jgi:hypothetical protein